MTNGQDPDDLLAWIASLRGRLGRGVLAALAPFDLGDGALATGELGVRVMLADLDHLGDLARNPPAGANVGGRRRRLLAAFRRLRALIG